MTRVKVKRIPNTISTSPVWVCPTHGHNGLDRPRKGCDCTCPQRKRAHEPFMPDNCPVRERTGDGTSVGRCWFHTTDGKCPRHGDVSAALTRYRETGQLSEVVGK